MLAIVAGDVDKGPAVAGPMRSADVVVAVGPADQLLLGHGALWGACAECKKLAALGVGRNGGDVLAELDLGKGGVGHGWRAVGAVPPMN